MGLLSFAVFHGFSSWLPQILEARGTSAAAAGFTASIPLITGIPAALVIPRITPPRARSSAITLLFVVSALSLVLVAASSGIVLVGGLVLFGLSSTAATPLLMLILMESPEIGAKYIGSAAGLFFCVAEVGGFTGPLILGAMRNTTGDFFLGTIFVAGLAVIMSVLGLYLKKRTARLV
jgi:cyanate permease